MPKFSAVAAKLGASSKGYKKFLRKTAYDKKQDKAISRLKTLEKAEDRQSPRILGATSGALAGIVQLINGTVQGDADQQRSGNRILIKKIECRMFAAPATVAVTGSNTASLVRFMIVRKVDANQTGIVNGELLNNGGTDANNFMATINQNYRKRYKVLFDKVMTITPKPNTTGLPLAAGVNPPTNLSLLDQHVIKFKKNFKKGIMVEYSPAATNDATITAITRNALFAVAYSADNGGYINVNHQTNMGYGV